MSKRKCGLCGRDPAEGHASVTVGDKETWYCHGDDDASLTCYERAQLGNAGAFTVAPEDWDGFVAMAKSMNIGKAAVGPQKLTEETPE
jgi:hypothetical protein